MEFTWKEIHLLIKHVQLHLFMLLSNANEEHLK